MIVEAPWWLFQTSINIQTQHMKQTAILLTLALAIGAGSALQTFAAEKKEKKETEIGKVMKGHEETLQG